MFDAAPPPMDPPAYTVRQEADLACLRIGAFLNRISRGQGGSPHGNRIVRIYLSRLQRSGGGSAQDWMARAETVEDIPYGQFMQQMNRCNPPARMR